MRYVSLLILLVACSDPATPIDGGEDGGGPADAALDARQGAQTDASEAGTTTDASDAAPPCVCSGVSTCCDGCHALTGACDDGLACSTGSICSSVGTCIGGSAVACAVTTPACQAASCAEPGGCAVASVNEGGPCSDGNVATGDDYCASGSCVGTPCECTTGPCCDGCFFRAPQFKCLDHGPIQGDCTGAYDIVTVTCGGTPTLELTIGDRYCSGASAACTGTAVPASNGEVQTGTCTQLQDDGMGSMPSNPLRCMPDPSSPLGERCRRCL